MNKKIAKRGIKTSL